MTFACAHRGNSSIYRENTIEAISSAIESGADVVEIDVRMSSDGEVVVIHDPTLERLWGVNRAVNTLSWREISQIRSDGYRIPLLKDVLALFIGKRTLLMIDMEPADPALHALRVVQGSELPLSQVTWCGNDDAMAAIKKAAPAARIWLAWDSLEYPTSSNIARIKPEFLNFEYSFVNAKMVKVAHDLDCKVSVWTVQDAPTMRWACAVGVDSITSDYLLRLQKVIEENPVFDNEPPRPLRLEEIDLALAEEVATGLGKWAARVMTWFDPGEMSFKINAGDIVTAIDLLIETHVREVIKANLKGHNLVGEEFGGKAISGVPNWFLDPIDGTTNFANRVPWTSFSLAMAFEAKPLVGVVAHPWIDRVYTAVSSKGARCNGKLISLENETGTSLSSRIVSTELMAYEPWPGMDRFLDELAERYCTMRIMGSGTLTLLGVAANQSVGSVISEFSPIDHLAAVLIVSESGGVVFNHAGEVDLFPSEGGILCAAPGVAKELYEIWRKVSP